MKPRPPAEERITPEVNMTGESDIVREDIAIPNDAIMTGVSRRHEKIAFPDDRVPIFDRTPTDRDMLAEHRFRPHHNPAGSIDIEPQILRRTANDRGMTDLALLAKGHPGQNLSVSANCRTAPDFDSCLDHGKRPYGNIGSKFSGRIDEGGGVDLQSRFGLLTTLS